MRANAAQVYGVGLMLEVLNDMLTLGGVGFVAGVLMPLAFRLVGYVIDSVRTVLKREV